MQSRQNFGKDSRVSRLVNQILVRRIAVCQVLLFLSLGGQAQTVIAFQIDVLNAARELRSSGNANLAMEQLATLLVSVEKSPDASSLQAQILHEMGQIHVEKRELAQAAACLERSLDKEPGQPVVHYEAGLVYRDMGEPRKAATHLEAAIANGFRNLGATFHLTTAYFASHQTAAGLERANQIIAAAPKSTDVPQRLGRLLLDHLYYKSALDAFRLAHENAPDDVDPWFYLALTHFALQQYPEAIRVLTSPPRGSSGPEAASLLAASQAGAGDLKKASQLLRNAILSWPRSPHAYLNLALIRLEQDQPDEAETLLDTFRSLGPAHDAKVFYTVKRNACTQLASEIHEKSWPTNEIERANLYFDLATQMQNRYHFASAVELLRLARRYEGSSVRLLFAAGRNCLNLAPQALEAIFFLGEAVAQDPTRDDVWHLLGRAHLRLANSNDAVAAFRKAWSLHPRAEYATSLGKGLQVVSGADAKSADAEVGALFRRALTLDPSNALAHYELGRLLLQNEQFDEARQHLLKAVGLEPDFYECYYLLIRLSVRTGDRAQSQKYIDRFERTKQALTQQSVVGSGYVNEGREP